MDTGKVIEKRIHVQNFLEDRVSSPLNHFNWLIQYRVSRRPGIMMQPSVRPNQAMSPFSKYKETL